jgi:hypothetical protein
LLINFELRPGISKRSPGDGIIISCPSRQHIGQKQHSDRYDFHVYSLKDKSFVEHGRRELKLWPGAIGQQ